MSEKEGYVVVYLQDTNTRREMTKEFKKGNTFELGESEYRVSGVVVDDILDIHFYTNEFADTKDLSKYILDKYSPEILISTFEGKGYLDKKKVAYKKGFKALAGISAQADFHFKVEHGDYVGALGVLKSGDVSLTDTFAGIPFYEKCFFGEHGPLMEYAIDAGYHDHYCQYDEVFPFDENGVHVLHRIVRCSDIALIEKALSLSADTGGTDHDQNTILHHIGHYAYSDEFDFDPVDFIIMLEKHGADFNVVNQEGATPLQRFSFDYSYDDSAFEIVEAFIKVGAALNVYDESGAGLLTDFYEHEDIKSLLLKSEPDLKPFTDEFNADAYIRKRTHILDRNLPRDYDRYFIRCAQRGLTDFLLQAENIEIIKSLNEKQLENILRRLIKMPIAAVVLEGLYKNDLPIVVEEYLGKRDEEPEFIPSFDFESNQAVVDYFASVPEDSYKVLVTIGISMGEIGRRRMIVDLKEP